jgi:hypothetical protein
MALDMGSVVQYLERDPFERLSTTTTIQHQNKISQPQSDNQCQNNTQHTNMIQQTNTTQQTSLGTSTKANIRTSGTSRPSSAPPGSMPPSLFVFVCFIYYPLISNSLLLLNLLLQE